MMTGSKVLSNARNELMKAVYALQEDIEGQLEKYVQLTMDECHMTRDEAINCLQELFEVSYDISFDHHYFADGFSTLDENPVITMTIKPKTDIGKSYLAKQRFNVLQDGNAVAIYNDNGDHYWIIDKGEPMMDDIDALCDFINYLQYKEE